MYNGNFTSDAAPFPIYYTPQRFMEFDVSIGIHHCFKEIHFSIATDLGVGARDLSSKHLLFGLWLWLKKWLHAVLVSRQQCGSKLGQFRLVRRQMSTDFVANINDLWFAKRDSREKPYSASLIWSIYVIVIPNTLFRSQLARFSWSLNYKTQKNYCIGN